MQRLEEEQRDTRAESTQLQADGRSVDLLWSASASAACACAGMLTLLACLLRKASSTRALTLHALASLVEASRRRCFAQATRGALQFAFSGQGAGLGAGDPEASPTQPNPAQPPNNPTQPDHPPTRHPRTLNRPPNPSQPNKPQPQPTQLHLGKARLRKTAASATPLQLHFLATARN